MATARRRTRFVDLSNPSLAIRCPRCGLACPRFSEYCGSCGYAIWPTPQAASAAFRQWRAHDPATRSAVRPFDLAFPVPDQTPVVDYDARAHELGIHVFPSSTWPFVICLGAFFLFLALVPFPALARVVLGVIGALITLVGIVGWVVIEDTRLYTTGAADSHPGTEPSGQVH